MQGRKPLPKQLTHSPTGQFTLVDNQETNCFLSIPCNLNNHFVRYWLWNNSDLVLNKR